MDSPQLIGKHPSFTSLLARLPLVARAGRPTLLTGETGVGKDVIAQQLRALSPRACRPFVVVHCGALPDHLVEAELFGHRRGAFTGAVDPRAGLIRTAGEGTLFFDEINSLSAAAQARLLRFLESGEYRAVGADQAERSGAWVIAATNQSLGDLSNKGAFRTDLVFRLSAVSLHVPALRERGDDVLLLAEHFLAGVRPGLRFSAQARLALRAWSWPGNVREMKHRVESAGLFCLDDQIEPEHLGLTTRPGAATPSAEGGTLTEQLWELIERDGLSLAAAVERCEALLIEEGLRRTRNNRTRAAARLGVHLRTLYKKLPAVCPAGHDPAYTNEGTQAGSALPSVRST